MEVMLPHNLPEEHQGGAKHVSRTAEQSQCVETIAAPPDLTKAGQHHLFLRCLEAHQLFYTQHSEHELVIPWVRSLCHALSCCGVGEGQRRQLGDMQSTRELSLGIWPSLVAAATSATPQTWGRGVSSCCGGLTWGRGRQGAAIPAPGKGKGDEGEEQPGLAARGHTPLPRY